MRVLLVEDDPTISEPLVTGLTRQGFDVDLVTTGAEALARAGEGVACVLLDLGLPDIDGTEVCRRLRAVSDVPIIVVTARADEVDRVVGLELGADDYLVKPFGFRELVARIRAVTRRAQAASAPEPPGTQPHPRDDAVTRFGALTVDRRTRRVDVAGAAMELTAKEFDLLALLAEDPGAVVERRAILDRVWDGQWYGPSRTLDVHVAMLRRKLGDPAWVETVRGVGYRLGRPHGAAGDA